MGTVAAADGDAGDSVTGYALQGGADASRFTIVEATGELTFTSAPNFEAAADADTNNDYVVVVRATSGTGARLKTADQTITVTVTDEAGEAPGAPATPTVSSASVSSVTVAWAAPSNAGPPITDYDYRYRVKTPPGSWTEVTTTPITGLRATITGLAENTEYEVQVRATNAEGTGGWSDPPGSGSTDANAAPSFTSSATFDAAENQLAVGTVAASDGDAGDSVTGYALQGGADASQFTIVEATGVLAFTSAPNFEAATDADTNNDYVVVVRATSGTGARLKTADQTITVTVTDEAGEAPGAPATPAVSSASVSSVTVAWAAPSNAGPPITDYDYRYRVKAPQGSWTEVTTTPITGLRATITGLAENTEYEVQVRATNAEGTGGWSDPPGSGSTDANAAPSFTSPATFDAAENQLAVGTVAASDGDPGDSVTGYAIQGGADASRFTIVEATGVLTFTSAPNFEAATDADTNNDYVVVVRATSGTGARLKTADQTITVTVTDEAGEAPGAPATPTVSSASVSSVTVAWAAPSNAGPPITDYDYRYRVKAPQGSWTEVTTTPITGLRATITGLAENTEYEVQVRATNAEGTGGWSDPPGSGSTDANAAPSFTSPATFDAAENQLAVGTVAASDGDPGDSVTGYAIQGGADASRFTIVEATGELTFTSAPNFEAATDADTNNDYVVVVRATSGTGARLKTADQTITVTVTDEAGEAPGAPATPAVSSVSATSGSATSLDGKLAPRRRTPAGRRSRSYDRCGRRTQYRIGDRGGVHGEPARGGDGPQDVTGLRADDRGPDREHRLRGAGARHQRRGRQRLVRLGCRQHQSARQQCPGVLRRHADAQHRGERGAEHQYRRGHSRGDGRGQRRYPDLRHGRHGCGLVHIRGLVAVDGGQDPRGARLRGEVELLGDDHGLGRHRQRHRRGDDHRHGRGRATRRARRAERVGDFRLGHEP